jgi:hypothetical protein
MTQQAQNNYYPDEEQLARAHADACNAEIRDRPSGYSFLLDAAERIHSQRGVLQPQRCGELV